MGGLISTYILNGLLSYKPDSALMADVRDKTFNGKGAGSKDAFHHTARTEMVFTRYLTIDREREREYVVLKLHLE